MSLITPIKPRERLLQAAELWSEATGRSLGALSSLVSNHGSTLDRLRDPANAVTDKVVEKFARYLIDPANWPEGVAVPEAVAAFGQVVGVCPHDPANSAPALAASAGKIGENSSVGGAR